MIVLGYSGLDASVRYARRDPDLLPGEERIVQGLDSAAAILVDGRIVAAAAEERFGTEKHTNVPAGSHPVLPERGRHHHYRANVVRPRRGRAA